ncbi:MAG: AAA family ATPase [Pelosinus sp.]|nr:AAA family ATPase [Pelosinus sp.]
MKYSCPQEVVLAMSQGEISSLDGFRLLQTMDNYLDIPSSASTNQEELQTLLQEMDALIGLTEVKKLVREIYAFIEIQKRRQAEKLLTEPLVLHMIFKGNPGTGKTTVARILGKIFCKMGVLSRGHLIEVERADLVGEYIGHTAQKTREQLKKAYGGILFIDEAYSLARGGEKDFGKESIDVMVKPWKQMGIKHGKLRSLCYTKIRIFCIIV